MSFFDFISDAILLVLLVVVLVIVYFAVTANNNYSYYIEPSMIDITFVEQVRRILNESKINKRYILREALSSDEADIDIRLVDRYKLHDPTDTIEYYPGTKKQIWFSYTWQKPKPHIAIDSINWLEGVNESGLSLDEYRKYVIRHEFLHALGYDHQPCNLVTAVDGVCPLLYQATRGPPTGFKSGYDVTEMDYQKRIENASLSN